MKAKIIVSVAMLIFFIVKTSAQDYHFSQFQDIPLLVNPAQTGAFSGDQRAILYYKNQWASIMNAYETFGFSFDCRIVKTRSENGYLSAGLTVTRDKAGKSELSITQPLISLAYHQKIGYNSTLTGGIQGGVTQWSVNYTSLNWHNQYDPNQQGFDQSLPTREDYNYSSFFHADFAGGVLYNFTSAATNMSSNDGFKFQVGASVHHVNRSKKTFSSVIDMKQYSKITIHSKSTIGLSNTNTAVVPLILYQKQGPNQEIICGTGFRYMLQESSRYTGFVKESALTVGCLMRIGDAVIPYLSFEYANYAIGISYDVNISSLRKASNSMGGFEINLRYINPNPFNTRNKSFY